MMASSSSSSNLSDHLVQDDLPWPSSSSLPFAPAPHSAVIGGGHQWSQQPLTQNCSNHHHSDELEVLLSAQGHNHSHHHAASPLVPHHLSSLLMMQDLGLQWNNCSSFADTSSMPMNGQQVQDGHNKIKEEQPLNSRSSCAAGTAISYHDIVVDGVGGIPTMAAAADLDGTVLPSVNISRPQQKAAWPAAPLPLPGDAFEILASSRLCKTLLLSQAASVLLHNGGMPLLRSEHVPHGPPAAPAHPHGPSIDSYKQQMGACAARGGGGRHWSADHDTAACHQKAARPAVAVVPAHPQAPSLKKPRVESHSSTIVPSFKVRKEKLGDRIAALQQLVSPFGKTDTASVLMEAIGYIKFLQDQVETLSCPYLKSSRNKNSKPKTAQRGSSNANANGGEQEETRLDLRSRGLCLVPLSCTSYVTNENGVWAPPNFGGN
ncbi:Transcription factor bHLH110 [Dichanthelium oligosanthes]|uniref:Transcription factor bHLH110 n=1 Tax=Dichanthelium oligosanthes TaxID=888268 RepID=A0A1E5W406_9POAL|nr:Transcription factor bHLH110 [Dichanthelium oligosanthes]